MGELAVKRPAQAVILNTAGIVLAAACLFVYFRIFAMELPNYYFADETSAYDVFLGRGFFSGISYYWHNFIGRPGALSWLGLPIVLSGRLGIDPWHAVVATRAFNYIAALVCLALLVKTVLPRLSHALSFAVAALILSACLTGIGTTAIKYYWLFDQAIYLFSFMTYCLVLLLFWRIVRIGPDKYALWLLPAFLLFITAHEVNLVAGGLMLALYFVILLLDGSIVRAAGWPAPGGAGPSSVSSAGALPLGARYLISRMLNYVRENAPLSLFVALSLIYVVMAYVQIFSPSLGFRYQIYPVERSWPDAAGLGIPAAFFPLLELGLGFQGAVLPILLAGGVLGAWHGAASGVDRRRGWLLLGPLGLAIVISLVMAVLSSRYRALMDPFYNFSDAKIFPFVERLGLISLPVRQNVYAYQLWFSAVFFVGVFFGIRAACGGVLAKRRWLLPLAGVTSAVWLAAASVMSPAFADAWRFDLLAGIAKVGKWLGPLTAPPGFDGRRYVEEPPPEMYVQWGWDKLPIGHPKGTTYPLDVALQMMYRGGPVVFVPCGVAGAQRQCNDDDIPRWQSRIDSAVVGLSAMWSTVSMGQAAIADGRLDFVEDTQDGEHYLATGELSKGGRSLVTMNTIVEQTGTAEGRDLWIELVSEDGLASVRFDLAHGTVLGHADYGARALDGSIRRFTGPDAAPRAGGAAAASRFELSARFVVFGKSDQFRIRLESAENGRSSYPGNGRSGWSVESSLIRVLNTGPSVARLRQAPAAERSGALSHGADLAR